MSSQNILIIRQLGVYEIEFTVLQEEQATNKSQVDRLKIDLEEKTKELSDARAEIASLQLRLRKELAEVNARHRDDSGIEEGWGAMQCNVECGREQSNVKCGDKYLYIFT